MWALFERQTNLDGCKPSSLVGILRGSNLRKVSIAKIMY